MYHIDVYDRYNDRAYVYIDNGKKVFGFECSSSAAEEIRMLIGYANMHLVHEKHVEDRITNSVVDSAPITLEEVQETINRISFEENED